jgi:ABC-type multidrug transport system permease subunit
VGTVSGVPRFWIWMQVVIVVFVVVGMVIAITRLA